MAERAKTTDTRALAEDELTERQKGALDELRRILQRMRADGATVQTSEEEPWARSYERSGRVILLNGGRGTGKTSTLLTLLTNPEKTPFVRCLQPVDLDPVPDGLPMIGWLLQALTPLARWLDGTSACPVDPSTRSRDSKVTQKTVIEQLRDLQRDAVLGWDWGRGQRDGRGQLDWALDFQNQLTGWADLEDRWRRLVDHMVARPKLAEALGTDGLLVISLDDPDLYRAQMRDLVLSLRLLYHPRIVFLLAGDLRQLTEELTLDLARQAARGLGSRDVVEGWLGQSMWVGQPATLARAILEKVLQKQNRVSLGRTSLWGLMGQPWQGGKSLLDLLDKFALPVQKESPRGAPTTLGQLLRGMGASFTGAFRDDDITLRTWAQLGEALQGIAAEGAPDEGAPADRLVRGLTALMGTVGDHVAESEARDRGRGVTDLYVRALLPSATLAYEPGVGLDSWAATAEGTPRTLLCRSRVYGLVQADGAGTGTPPHPFLLLAAEARDRLPARIRLEGSPPLRLEAWTWLIHTRVQLNGLEVDVPWPWAQPATLADLLWWLEKVPKAFPGQESAPEDPISWVLPWIRLHFEFFGLGPEAESRDALLLKARGPMPVVLRLWLTERLPLLAAPETGLPESVSAAILEFYNEVRIVTTPHLPALNFKNQDLRKAHLRAALAGAGRPEAGTPHAELVTPIFEALSTDDAHPWAAESRREEWGWSWWLFTRVGQAPGSASQLNDLLLRRTYIGRTVADSEEVSRNLLDLFLSNNMANFVTRAWSELLRPTAVLGSRRLRSLMNVASYFTEWEGDASALAVSRFYNWLLEQTPEAPWRDRVTVDPSGARLTMRPETPLIFRIDNMTQWAEIGSVRLRNAQWEAWSLTGLPELAQQMEKVEGRAWVALLAVIQSLIANQGNAEIGRDEDTQWTVEVPDLIQVRTRGSIYTSLPAPPLRSWIDVENLRIAMGGAQQFMTGKRGIDPEPARARWLLLAWVETCCDLLNGRVVRLRGEAIPDHQYPVENLSRLARTCKGLQKLARSATAGVQSWASSTETLVRLALDPEAREAWDQGRKTDQPVVRSPVLTILNSANAATIRAAGIPFIGPVTSKKVVAYIKEYGPIESLDDLVYVHGIKEPSLLRIKAYDEELSAAANKP